MNQIIMIGNKNKNNNKKDIKKIIIFFSIAMVVFGSILIIDGVVGLNSNKNQVGIIPSTPSPWPTSDTLVYDDDEENPKIELNIAGENVKILVTDNLELDYIEYAWNDEEVKKEYPKEDNKKEIQIDIKIKQGVNNLKVIAVDKAGNNQEKTQSFQGKIRPEVKIEKTTKGDVAIITAVCEDGLSKIDFTLNGEQSTIPLENLHYTDEEWATINVVVEYSSDGKIVKIQYTHPFVEGENELVVYAYSLEGLVGDKSGTNIYTPEQ